MKGKSYTCSLHSHIHTLRSACTDHSSLVCAWLLEAAPHCCDIIPTADLQYGELVICFYKLPLMFLFFFFPLVEDIFANAHSHLGRNLCRYTFNKWVSSKTDGTLLSARDLNRLSKFSAFQHNLFYFQARKDFFSPVSRIKCWQINVSAKHRCAHICRLSFNIRNRDTTRYSGQFPALLVATKAYFFIKKPKVF